MSDEKNDTSQTSAPAPAEPTTSLGSAFGVPLEAFVRGQRSRPASHDRMIAEEEADAERRRDVAAAERKAAAKPIHQGGAMMYENKFQDNAEQSQSFVSLEYVTDRGEPVYLQGQELGCLADVQALPDGSVQIILVCPKCKAEGLPQGRCQMTVNSRNKRVDLDMSSAGEMVLFNDGFGAKAYRSAGVVRETDSFGCYQCNARYRIVKNKVRPA